MKKQNIKWKREFDDKDSLFFTYYHLLLIGFNRFSLSDKEIKLLVELTKHSYATKDLNELAEKVGFKHQVLKNSFTKLKKMKLVYCVANVYSINPSLALDNTIDSIELNINTNVTV